MTEIFRYSSHRAQEQEYAASCLHVRGVFLFLSASGTRNIQGADGFGFVPGNGIIHTY